MNASAEVTLNVLGFQYLTWITWNLFWPDPEWINFDLTWIYVNLPETWIILKNSGKVSDSVDFLQCFQIFSHLPPTTWILRVLILSLKSSSRSLHSKYLRTKYVECRKTVGHYSDVNSFVFVTSIYCDCKFYHLNGRRIIILNVYTQFIQIYKKEKKNLTKTNQETKNNDR